MIAATDMRKEDPMSAVPAQPSQAAEPLLLRRADDGVVTLTMNRPAARNALSEALIEAMQAELDQIRDDPAVRVLVIAGAGPAYCAGHDLREVRARVDRAFYERLLAKCARMMTSIVRLPKPVIARVHGVATAAGCQLVASCDLAVAADVAQFATPGVNIGLFCSTPMVALSRNVARKHAMEMLLTGDLVDATTAQQIGLVNRAVPAAKLDETVMALARQIASKSSYTLKIGKEAFYRQLELPLDEAYAYASRVMTENLMAQDAAEGVDAFLQKRTPVWKGC
jgi:enoyl-CoA hydratase/carnithine racemase